MTDDIDEMTPEQLRVAVAVEVMGMQWEECYNDFNALRIGGKYPDYALRHNKSNTIVFQELPDYPNDIAAAWTVLDKACVYEIYNHGNDGKNITVSLAMPDTNFFSGDGKAVQVAICRAALRAVRSAKR